MNRNLTRLLLVASAAILAACGGSNDHPAPAAVDNTVVPDTALASTDAYASFVGSLPVQDTIEPRSLDKVSMAPTSETAEPTPLQ